MKREKNIVYMVMALRDPLSGLTHFIGALLAVVGLIALIFKALDPLKPWHLSSYIIFGIGMILLYTSSTLYHWLPLTEQGTQRLRKMDHMMIFILIAASYTPFCLVPLRGVWGWSIFGVVWSVALMGIVFKIFWIQAPRWLSALLYILMGWIAMAGIVPLVKVLQGGALFWLFAGGLLYTTGGIIYAMKRPNPFPKIFGFHEIFHIFIMLGTCAHFWDVYHYVSMFS